MRFCGHRSGCCPGDLTGWEAAFCLITNATGRTAVTECVTGDLRMAVRGTRAGISTPAGVAAAGSRWRGSVTTITREFRFIRGRAGKDSAVGAITRWRALAADLVSCAADKTSAQEGFLRQGPAGAPTMGLLEAE